MFAETSGFFTEMTLREAVEGFAFFSILAFALLCFVRSSSSLPRYFIPVICIIAGGLLIMYWGESGNEPASLLPLVRAIAPWRA